MCNNQLKLNEDKTEAILFSNLTMKQHVIRICQTAYYELKRISSIRRYLTEDAAKQTVTSCVLSRLDYCKSLLMGTPNSVTTASTTVFSSYTGGSVMVCVNGEPHFHSVVLLLVYVASV